MSIYSLISHLIQYGMKEKNLFEESGDLSILAKIQDLLDSGVSIPSDFTTPMHINSIAESLLCLLDSLPTSLIPSELYESCLEAYDDPAMARQILRKMPPIHQQVFDYLFCFIRKYILSTNGNLKVQHVVQTFVKIIVKAPAQVSAVPQREISFLTTLLL